MLYKTPIIYGNKQFVPAEFLPVTQTEERRPLFLKLNFVLRKCKLALHLGGGRVTTGLQSYFNISPGAGKDIVPSQDPHSRN